jgi:hypothetical protein
MKNVILKKLCCMQTHVAFIGRDSGYARLWDTGAAILQKADVLSSSTTENLLWPAAMLLK